MRTEHDTLGPKEVPEKALYGIHTQRALDNFGADGARVKPELIRAMVVVKKACALTHNELGALAPEVADALVAACDEVLSGGHGEAFVTAALQGGAGTSMNMNVNEVLANLAIVKLGGTLGDYSQVHPLDHVNRGQSTNDVVPSALRIAAIFLVRDLAKALSRLQDSLQKKEKAFADIPKLGRCPSCDGPLFKGKRVAVIGGGNSGVEAAIDLAGVVEHVTVFEFMPELKADAVLQKKLTSLPNVTIIKNAQTTEVLGDGSKVTGLSYKDRSNDEVKQVQLEGIFVQIGLLPNTDWLKGTLELNKMGEIVIDAKGQTSVPGVFAAGDCTNVPYKQIIVAAGAGAVAGLSAFEHLIRH